MAAQFDVDPDEYCEELKQMNQEQFSKCQYIKKACGLDLESFLQKIESKP